MYIILLTALINLTLQDTWSTAAIDKFKELCAATEFLHMTVVRAEGIVAVNGQKFLTSFWQLTPSSYCKEVLEVIYQT